MDILINITNKALIVVDVLFMLVKVMQAVN